MKIESAGLKKVDIKAHTSRRLSGVSLCMIQYVRYKIEHTSTYKYILVHACTYWNIHNI